jgi:hypothetical protein
MVALALPTIWYPTILVNVSTRAGRMFVVPIWFGERSLALADDKTHRLVWLYKFNEYGLLGKVVVVEYVSGDTNGPQRNVTELICSGTDVCPHTTGVGL